jgi:hypothetical protein
MITTWKRRVAEPRAKGVLTGIVDANPGKIRYRSGQPLLLVSGKSYRVFGGIRLGG